MHRFKLRRGTAAALDAPPPPLSSRGTTTGSVLVEGAAVRFNGFSKPFSDRLTDWSLRLWSANQ